MRVAGDIATGEASPACITALARKFPAHSAILACVVPKLAPAFRRAFWRAVDGSRRGIARNSAYLFDYPKPQNSAPTASPPPSPRTPGGNIPRSSSPAARRPPSPYSTRRAGSAAGPSRPDCRRNWPRCSAHRAIARDTLLQQPRSALAKSTQEAIRAGVMLNFQGGVKEIIRQLSAALPRSHEAAPHPHRRQRAPSREKSRCSLHAAPFTRL